MPLYLAVGLRLTWGCCGLQLRQLKVALVLPFSKEEQGRGVSPFQAASTALGAAIGTGNVVGTAQAICLGGPGALFWLWCSAILGMILQYGELYLGQIYGGPMGGIRRALGPFAAAVWGVLCLASVLCMGNLAQVHSAASAVCRSGQGRLLFGLLLSLLTLWALNGGAVRIGRVSAALVPPMAIAFFLLCLGVILKNAAALPDVLRMIISGAFRPQAILGAIHWGFRRGTFSNEAGLGTAALAHQEIKSADPAHHALWGLFQVALDSLVLCTVTGLAILCSGVWVPYGSLPGPELLQHAIASVFGQGFAAFAVVAALLLFGFSTVLASAAYGLNCLRAVPGRFWKPCFQLLYALLVLLAPLLPAEGIWATADAVNVFLAVPNLLMLLLLSPSVCRAARTVLDECRQKRYTQSTT